MRSSKVQELYCLKNMIAILILNYGSYYLIHKNIYFWILEKIYVRLFLKYLIYYNANIFFMLFVIVSYF